MSKKNREIKREDLQNTLIKPKNKCRFFAPRKMSRYYAQKRKKKTSENTKNEAIKLSSKNLTGSARSARYPARS